MQVSISRRYRTNPQIMSKVYSRELHNRLIQCICKFFHNPYFLFSFTRLKHTERNENEANEISVMHVSRAGLILRVLSPELSPSLFSLLHRREIIGNRCKQTLSKFIINATTLWPNFLNPFVVSFCKQLENSLTSTTKFFFDLHVTSNRKDRTEYIVGTAKLFYIFDKFNLL